MTLAILICCLQHLWCTQAIFGGEEKEHPNLWEHINWLSTVVVYCQG